MTGSEKVYLYNIIARFWMDHDLSPVERAVLNAHVRMGEGVNTDSELSYFSGVDQNTVKKTNESLRGKLLITLDRTYDRFNSYSFSGLLAWAGDRGKEPF